MIEHGPSRCHAGRVEKVLLCSRGLKRLVVCRVMQGCYGASGRRISDGGKGRISRSCRRPSLAIR